jgi:hypothetical protein
MIEPVFRLLQEANVSRRTGVLILVVVCNGPVSRIFTLSLTFRAGELMTVLEGSRHGFAALRLLHEASFLRRHHWLDLPEDDESITSDLPSLRGVLDDVADDPAGPWAEEKLPVSEQLYVDRLNEIQAFLQTMAGECGNDVFLKRVFQHSPSDDWERLMDGLCQDIETLFGANVAAKVMTMGKNHFTAADCF